jgi:hypothetical protein
MSSLVEIAKAVDADKKRKEQQFGLANNAFGAAAGAYGTRAVYQQARQKHYPEQVKAKQIARQQKVSDRAAARYKAGKPAFGAVTRAKQRVGAVVNKVPKKYLAPAAISAAVGSQLVNAAADAQSAAYFGREIATGKKSRSAPDGQQGRVGKSLQSYDGHVGKAFRSFDPEADRRHRLGIYEGAGAIGTVAGLGYAGRDISQRVKVVPKGTRKASFEAALKRNKRLGIGLGGATAAATGGIAARRAYLRDRNQPWT